MIFPPFRRYYRARAFADGIVKRNDSIRLEVFRRLPNRFEVSMLFVDDQERRAGIDILRERGIELED